MFHVYCETIWSLWKKTVLNVFNVIEWSRERCSLKKAQEHMLTFIHALLNGKRCFTLCFEEDVSDDATNYATFIYALLKKKRWFTLCFKNMSVIILLLLEPSLLLSWIFHSSCMFDAGHARIILGAEHIGHYGISDEAICLEAPVWGKLVIRAWGWFGDINSYMKKL